MIYEVAGGVAAAAIAIKSLPVLWGFIRGASQVPKMAEAVVREFGAGGGSSMRDAINRLEAAVDDVRVHGVAGYRETSDRVRIVEERVTVNDFRIEELEKKVGKP